MTGRAEADEGLWISFGVAMRLIVGWFSIVIGFLNLLADADRRTGEWDLPFLIFHCLLVAGGIMLLALNWLAEDPGLAGYAVGAAVATIGLVVSAVPATSTVCCMFGFAVRHGFPFTFLARTGARWHLDSQHLIADLLFWGYAGLLALVLVALYRRITSRGADPLPVETGRNRHAEPVAHADEPLPADGTVGGLP